MGEKQKNEYGFKPRFIPKSTKGEKRKRSVRFWENLNQESNCEELYQEIVEQEEKKTVTEKGQKEKKKGEKKNRRGRQSVMKRIMKIWIGVRKQKESEVKRMRT
ncbi:unnamed protein product [Meganyctiphanes norvegica]|uniref:Uncharacterized protein n=1 Tax=Meganyctiphanes norvegica TaxID=48144 RepID=A0AAV2QJH7_MEGNR